MQILAKANFQITLKTTPITSNYQENNLLYLICLHDIELSRIQPLSLLFMPDLDNRVIFVNGVMGLEMMGLEGKATCPKSQAGTWYRPGWIPTHPYESKTSILYTTPNCLLKKA